MKVADIGVPQQASIDRTHGFTNSLTWNLGPALELRAITAWRGVDASHWDNSGGAHRPPVFVPNSTVTINGVATPGSLFSRYSLADLRQRQFSQELQAVGTVDSIDYVAGLFWFNEHVSDDAATPSSNLWNATDVLHLTVGGRYTHDRKRGILHVSRGGNYDTNPPAASVGYQPLDKSWNRFNPMVTLAYDVTEQTHVYAKYATGYRAGGASSRTSNYQPFDPEDVKSYEVGLKTDLFNHRARLNLAGYIMDRKDSQVDISSIQFVGSSSFNNLVTINAPGITKIRGIEADLTVNPVEGLTLNAAYAYTHTKTPPVLITARDAAGRSISVYQCPAMQPRDRLRERKAEAVAALVGIEPAEAAQRKGARLGRDARAVIDDEDARVAARLYPDGDPAARGRVPDRVLDEIQQYLHQQRPVADMLDGCRSAQVKAMRGFRGIGSTSAATSPANWSRRSRAKASRLARLSIDAMRSKAENISSSPSACAVAACSAEATGMASGRCSIAASSLRNRASGVRSSCDISLETMRISATSVPIRSSIALNAAACRSNAPPSPFCGTRLPRSPAAIDPAVRPISSIRRATSRRNSSSPARTMTMMAPNPTRWISRRTAK